MPKPQLRIYYGPDEESVEVDTATEPLRTVNVPLGELVAVLAEAIRSDRQWLRDFADDPVTISEDLYEVLLVYDRMSRPPA